MKTEETTTGTPAGETTSTTSTIDQQRAPPTNSSAPSIEKTEVSEKEIDTDKETDEEEKKRKKKEKVGRILTFLGLQIALFLAALDGYVNQSTESFHNLSYYSDLILFVFKYYCRHCFTPYWI